MEPIIANQSIRMILSILSEEDTQGYTSMLNKLNENQDFSAPKYCVDKFIKSEMDTQCSGLRGVGRVSDNPPRFGGYFRSQINHLYKDETLALENLLKDLLYIGYFSHIYICEEAIKPTEVEDRFKLYQMWIMFIIGFDSKSLFYNAKIIDNLFEKTKVRLRNKMVELNISLSLHDEEVLQNILYFYRVAGFTLRRREVGIKL